MSNVNGTATNAPFGFRFIKRGNESLPPLDYRVVSSGVTVVPNTLGIINASTGNLDNHTPGAAEKIFCIINQGGTAGSLVQVSPIYPGDILTAQSVSATVVAQSDIGDTCEVSGTTATTQGLNVGTASNPIFKILELSEDPLGTTLGQYTTLNCVLLSAASAVLA